MLWQDYRLQWNPSDYANITYVTLLISELWLPDVMAMER